MRLQCGLLLSLLVGLSRSWCLSLMRALPRWHSVMPVVCPFGLLPVVHPRLAFVQWAVYTPLVVFVALCLATALLWRLMHEEFRVSGCHLLWVSVSCLSVFWTVLSV